MEKSISVLIADGNEKFANSVRDFLTCQEGIDVKAVVTNGRDAYEKVIETKPDVMLMDMIMPYVDGLGVLKKIKTSKLEKEPVVMIMSAEIVHIIIVVKKTSNKPQSPCFTGSLVVDAA